MDARLDNFAGLVHDDVEGERQDAVTDGQVAFQATVIVQLNPIIAAVAHEIFGNTRIIVEVQPNNLQFGLGVLRFKFVERSDFSFTAFAPPGPSMIDKRSSEVGFGGKVASIEGWAA